MNFSKLKQHVKSSDTDWYGPLFNAALSVIMMTLAKMHWYSYDSIAYFGFVIALVCNLPWEAVKEQERNHKNHATTWYERMQNAGFIRVTFALGVLAYSAAYVSIVAPSDSIVAPHSTSLPAMTFVKI
jgi:hypothetical protein